MLQSKLLLDLSNLEGDDEAIQRLIPYIGFLLNKTAHKMKEQTDESLKTFDLKAQHFITLSLLSMTDGDLSQKEVGNQLFIDRNTMVSIVDHLEKYDLAVRNRDPNDRRSYCLDITEKGRKLLEQTSPVVCTTHTGFIGTLNADETLQLIKILAKLLSANS